MARPLWRGNISFGLVTIPVQLFTAVRDVGVHFHMLSPDGKCRLRRKLFCPETGKEFDFSETARGYELAPGQYVIVDEDELEKLEPDSGRTIHIMDFVDLESIDPIYYDRPYYVMPDGTAAKAFQLLVDAMESSKRVAIAAFSMRGNEYLGALRVRDKVICLHTMHFEEEIVAVDSLDYKPAKKGTDKRELALASQLIDKLYASFEPDKYHNEQRERVMELVEKKAKGQKITPAKSEGRKPTKVVDLLEVLKKSVKKGSEPEPKKKRAGTDAKRRGAEREEAPRKTAARGGRKR